MDSNKGRLIIRHRTMTATSLFFLISFSMLMLTMSGGGDGGAGNLLRQVLYLAIIGAGLVGARAFSDLRKFIEMPLSILVILAWCWLSMAWAIDAGTSMRRLILTTLMFVGVFSMVNSLGFVDSYRIVLRSLLFLVGVSFLAAVLVPSIGVHLSNDFDSDDIVGNWRGVFGHKNYAGAIAAILMLMLIFSQVRMNGWLRFFAIGATAIFIYQTQSKTSAALAVVAIVVGWFIMQYSPRYRQFALFTFLVLWIIAPVAIWWNWDVLSPNFTSADAFTGRGQIWPGMAAFHEDHWFGAGFGSFWNIDVANPILSYVPFKSYVETISSGHNGYLDLLVTIGPIGVFLVVVGLIILPTANILWSPYITRNQAGLVMAVILFTAGNNVTETSLMDRDSPVHILLITFVAMLGVAIRGGRAKYAMEQYSDADQEPPDVKNLHNALTVTGRK